MVHCTTGHRSLTLLRLTLVTTMLIISALRVLSSKSSSPAKFLAATSLGVVSYLSSPQQ